MCACMKQRLSSHCSHGLSSTSLCRVLCRMRFAVDVRLRFVLRLLYIHNTLDFHYSKWWLHSPHPVAHLGAVTRFITFVVVGCSVFYASFPFSLFFCFLSFSTFLSSRLLRSYHHRHAYHLRRWTVDARSGDGLKYDRFPCYL